jgi:FkbM family methyltransferase
MGALEAIRSYHTLFGSYGAVLAAIARLFRKSTEVIVEVPGIAYPLNLRLRTTDPTTLWQVLVLAEYDWEFAKSPKVIVDAGANIGITSVFYANKYPGAIIIAIEPDSSNYEMLKKNTRPYSNVFPVRGALWKENRQVVLIDPGLGHYGFQTVAEPELRTQSRRDDVLGITVDKLMLNFSITHIDLLKLDIEGSEKEVFEDCLNWIDKVGVIVIELHDRLRTGCSRSVYRAAKDFEFESRKGETVFLMRREYVIGGTLLQPSSVDAFLEGSPCEVRTKPRFRILRRA